VPTVVQLPAGKALTVRTYAIGVGKIADRLGEARPPAVADDEIGEALETLWDRRESVLSWLGWCTERRLRGVGGPGLGRAAHPAGFADPGPLEDQHATPADA
jgi:hypothetical protein